MPSMAQTGRRLPAALLVAAATAIAFTALAGVQATGGSEAGESLVLGYPAVGDRWTYQVVVDGPWRFGEADTDMGEGRPFPFAEMEWLEPTVVRDRDGVERAVDRLHSRVQEYNGDEDYADSHDGHHWIPREATRLYVAGTADSVAIESPSTSEQRGSDVGLLVIDNEPLIATETLEVVEGSSRWFSDGHAPCLGRSPLQGTHIALDEPVDLFADCLPRFDETEAEADDGFWSYAPMAGLGPFEHAATETLLGHRAYRFDSEDGVSIWLAQGVPVPLQARGQRGDQVATVTLSSYEPGSSPLGASFPAPVPGEAPPIRLAPRQPWGPDDSGVGHPFPASAAFRGALQDPSFPYLRDWLRANPGGTTYWLEYSEDADSVPQTRSWFFALTAHGSTAAFHATQTSYAPLPLPATVQYSESAAGYASAWLSSWAPDVDAVPTELPTVASLTARWQAYEATEGRDPTPNGWAMGLMCILDCSYGLHGAVAAGRDPVALMPMEGFRLGPSTLPQAPQVENRTFTGSQLDVRADGQTQSLTQWTGYHTGLKVTPLEGQSPVDPTTKPAPEKAGPRRVLATLVPSPEQGAAITVASALAGLLYWLWPTLKGGAAGLFSRVTGPKLLDHPARARLVQLVQAEPGVHFQDLVRRSGLPNGTAVHHLRKLTDAGLLAARPLGRYTCYFPGSSPDRATLAAAPVTRADGARRILAELAANPGLSGGDLAMRLGIQPSTVTYHVKRLQDAGLVAAARDGRVIRFRTTGPTAAWAAAGA